MKSEIAIDVRHISKKFRVYLDRGHTLKELALFEKRRKYSERIVLNDISFQVKRGEAIGLIGSNGCGKSTLLKLLTRIMYPDSGEIKMCGRVSSLIELGAGFHPDMTGRQNIYTNASIFGLTRTEIEKRIETIIDFSELQEVIDTPVRTYSSGMYMRLAFAVAINVDADILLIDEILAVGDAAFQAKCFEKMHEIKRNGTTIVLVSHSMGQIEQICDRSIWIYEGRIRQIGEPKKVGEEYLSLMEQKRIEGIEFQKHLERKARDTEETAVIEEKESPKEKKVDEILSEQPIEEDKWVKMRNKIPKFAEKTAIRMGTGEIEFTGIKMLDVAGNYKTAFKTGDKITIQMHYISHIPGTKANFGIGIFREDGVHCYGTNIEIEDGEKMVSLNEGCVTVTIDHCELLTGRYFLDIAVHGEEGYYFDDIRRVLSFYMTRNKRDCGVCRIETVWKTQK